MRCPVKKDKPVQSKEASNAVFVSNIQAAHDSGDRCLLDGTPPVASKALAQDKKTNIVVISGDDVGRSNVGGYSHGLNGYQTPNIDRIAKEGVMFTDY